MTEGKEMTELGFDYDERVEEASEDQGTTKLYNALIEAGIEDVTVEQTGGFTMVVYVWSSDRKSAITLNAWSIGYEPDTEEGGNDWEDIAILKEEEGLDHTDILVELVKKNLHLLVAAKASCGACGLNFSIVGLEGVDNQGHLEYTHSDCDLDV